MARLAAQAVHSYPAGAPPVDAMQLFAMLSHLLVDACVLLDAGSPLQQLNAAQQLMSALPGLFAWMQRPLLALGSGQLAACCDSWCHITEWVGEWASRLVQAANLSQLAADVRCAHVQAWCSGAHVALRCLMPLAHLAQQAALLLREQQAQQAQVKLQSLALDVLQFSAHCSTGAGGLLTLLATADVDEAALSPQQLGECHSAVHLLHAARCRAVHWLLQDSGRRDALPVLRAPVELIDACYATFKAAVALQGMMACTAEQSRCASTPCGMMIVAQHACPNDCRGPGMCLTSQWQAVHAGCCGRAMRPGSKP